MRLRDRNLIDQIEGDALSNDVPVAQTLRKLIALGGQAGSAELRDWASRELRGYKGSGVDIPQYRKPGAVIQVDAITPTHQITGQQISPRQLPDVVAQHVDEEVPLGQPIGEIEEMLERARASDGYLKMTLPRSQDVATLMNHEVGDPFQRVTAVYWSVSQSALQGVIDQVKTTLVELVAEMRAGMPDPAETPSAALADQAVNVVVHGRGARVSVSSANASGSGSHQVRAAPEGDGASRWRKLGAAIVGLASVVGVFIALAQWQGWGF